MNRKEELDHSINLFLKEKGIHKIIAFSGGSNTELGGIPEKDPLQLKYKELQQEYERAHTQFNHFH